MIVSLLAGLGLGGPQAEIRTLHLIRRSSPGSPVNRLVFYEVRR